MATIRVLLNVVGARVIPITLDEENNPVPDNPPPLLGSSDEIEWSVSTGFCVSQISFQNVIPFGDGQSPACLPAFISSGLGGMLSGPPRASLVPPDRPEVEFDYDVYVFPEAGFTSGSPARYGRGRVRIRRR